MKVDDLDGLGNGRALSHFMPKRTCREMSSIPRIEMYPGLSVLSQARGSHREVGASHITAGAFARPEGPHGTEPHAPDSESPKRWEHRSRVPFSSTNQPSAEDQCQKFLARGALSAQYQRSRLCANRPAHGSRGPPRRLPARSEKNGLKGETGARPSSWAMSL